MDRSLRLALASVRRESGPQRLTTAWRSVTSVTSTEPSSGRCSRSQPRSLAAEAGPRRHAKRRLPEARHGHVALDPPPRVEALRVDEAPDGTIHVVGAEPLQERESPGTRHVELAERRHVQHAHALPDRAVLARDVLPVARALPGPLVGSLPTAGSPRSEVVRPLPACALPEHGAEREEPLEERARPEGPTPLALVAGKPRRVVVAVHLAGLLGDVAAVAEMGAESADVQLPHVDGGLPLEDPLGHHASDAPRARDPVDRHPRRHPEAGLAGHRAERVVAVRREAVRPVDELQDLGLLDGREPPHRSRQQGLEQRPIAREQLLRELPGHVVEAPGLRVGLEPADQIAADLLAHVHEVLRIAHHRGLAGQLLAGNRPRDQVLVHQRNDRQVDADHRRHAGRPLARGVDHALGADGARRRLDLPDPAARVEPDAGDPRPRDDLRPSRHGSAGQLARDAVGLEVPIVRHVHRAVEALPAHHGAEPQRLARRDDADVQPERSRPAHAPLKLLERRGARGESEAPDRPPAGGLAHLGGDLAVEPDAVAHQEHVGGRRAELRHEADRVKGRPAGQLALLDENDLAAPRGREMVRDAAADDAAADDDDRRLRAHGGWRRGYRDRRSFRRGRPRGPGRRRGPPPCPSTGKGSA